MIVFQVLLALLLIVAPAYAQEQHAMANPVDRAIQVGISGVLGLVLWVLWKHYKKEKLAWAKEKDVLKAEHKKEIEDLHKAHKAEADALRDRLEKEQNDRRQEATGLWKQNNETTREVMTVVQNMIHAMEHNSHVVEAWTNEIEGDE